MMRLSVRLIGAYSRHIKRIRAAEQIGLIEAFAAGQADPKDRTRFVRDLQRIAGHVAKRRIRGLDAVASFINGKG